MTSRRPPDPSMQAMALQVKRRARDLGFDLVGIAPAAPSVYRDYLRHWLDSGQAGTMHFLAQRFEQRTDVRAYLAGAASVICVAMNYHVPLAAAEPGQARGRVARYTLGEDYHELMKRRLFGLADWLRQRCPGAATRVAADTAPVMEKELAARAGIGWMGKSTCIIHPRIGSWLLLGEVLTTAELAADEPAVDHCGSCTRCIEACPTGAITEPYQLDARRCISYLTIEHRGDIDDELRPKISGWLYGCDICQEVCPWNRAPPTATDPALQPRFADGSLDPAKVLRWTPEEYRSRLRGSAMKRVKLPMLQRNARIAMENP